MDLEINKAVGHKCANDKFDVKVIQTLFQVMDGCWKKPKNITISSVDGKCGKNTIKTIEAFQKYAVGFSNPDGRIDPNGKTFQFLTMYLSPLEKMKIYFELKSSIVTKFVLDKARILNSAGMSDLVVSYKTGAHGIPKDKQVVSNYAKDVIKMALKMSGMKKAVISSTRREPLEQATIMYDNAIINYQKQIDLYGPVGENVLKNAFKPNKSKPRSEVIALMEQKIIELNNIGQRTSKHVVTKDQYKKLNVIDIGLNVTKSANPNCFNAKKFTEALKSLKKDGYIFDYIDETKKTNCAWHIEIKPGVKPIPIENIDASLGLFSGLCKT